VFAAVRNNEKALEYTSDKLKKNKQFLIKCYRKNKNTFKYNDFIKEFDKLENGDFNINIILNNIDILYLIKNKEQLCKYLLDNEQYNIIYKNEKIAEFIKNKYKVVLLSLDEIKPLTETNDNVINIIEEYTEEEIKKIYREKFNRINPELTLIFIE
jgi:hypothetical protein